MIGLTGGFAVAGEAESGEDAVAQVDARTPDLVLMDINLPGINGIEATRRIRAAHPDDAGDPPLDVLEADLPADARDVRRARVRAQGRLRPRARARALGRRRS